MTAQSTSPGEADLSIEHALPSKATGHPLAFWFFFWGEFAERCSYYGMRGILPLYLTTVLGFPDAKAAPIYYYFKMACYFLPLVGGFLADRFFGRYWTIVGFSVPYVLGHFILGIPNHAALFVALALLAGGSGVIKPNISTLMGETYDRQRPGNEQLRAAAFMWFYFAINVGAALSMFVVPILRNRYGYARAFQFPAWLMVLALIVFAAGKRHYAAEAVKRREMTQEEREERWRTLGRLLGIFGLFVFFWIGYEHADSLWVYFARDYVNMKLPFIKTPISPDQPGLINPVCVLIFIPIFDWLFRRLDPQARVITAQRKIFAGFLLAASASAVMSLAGLQIHVNGPKVPIAWLAAAYVLLTLGEILLYGTGLELAYAAAPKNLKGFVTACFLLTSTLGNFVNVWFSPLYGGSKTDPVRGPLSPAQFFGLTAAMTVCAAIAFLFVGRRLTRRANDIGIA